ncbi:hypothetical protein CK203_090109 [Vitis vinifera]|uniref:Uncharacterized protein n=1 Tax=Vitis vinifera TaxID=29760 RepID=A0A438E5X9_VITVI|nr:hypothetical protein CK203_090109 [Vitis vinifera]
MPTKNDVASSSAVGLSGKNASGQTYSEKPTDKLNEIQFRERFYIPNGVSVQLVDGEAMSTEKAANNAVYFSNEQFNAGSGFLFRLSSKSFFTSLRFLQLISSLFTPSRREDKPLQPVCPYPVPSIGDQPSGFEQGGNQRVCTDQGSLGRYIQEGSLGRVGGEGLFRSFEQAVRDHFHRETLPDTSFCLKLVGGRLGTSVVHPQYSPQVTTQGCSVRGTLMLKDLPFYERAREADAKAHQERLH